MQKNLKNLNHIVYKKISNSYWAKDVRCVKINNENIILKSYYNKSRYLQEKNGIFYFKKMKLLYQP